MPRIKREALTVKTVDAAGPKERAYRLWDAKQPGLCLRVLPSGRRTWEVHWTHNKALALGTYPTMTLDMARTRARLRMAETEEHGAPLVVLKARCGAVATLTLRGFVDEHYGPWALEHQKAGQATIDGIKAAFVDLLDKPLANVCAFDLERFKAARLKAGIKPATVNRDLDRIRGALSRAVDWDMLPAHPLRPVKRVKGDDNTRVRFLTTDEEARLRGALARREARRRASRASSIAWAEQRHGEPRPVWPADGFSDHLAPLVLVAINTGMRRGELFGLEWSAVNLQGRQVTVVAGTAKSRRARHVPLNAEAADVLARWKAQGSGAGLVFPGAGGARLTNVNKAWGALVLAAELVDFRFHDCRHHFASRLVQNGVDLYTVKTLLGHSDFAMTQRYAHLAPDHLAAAVGRLDARA